MIEDKKEQQPAESNYTQYMQELEEYPAFDRQKAYDDWKNGGKPILEALISNYKKPEQEITPEQERKIRTASALTDGLTTLAEMFAHGRGAYVRPRQGESNQQKTNSRLQEIKDKYEQDLMRYNSARSEAEMRDFSDYLRSSMAAHGQKRENLLLKTRNAWDAKRAAESLEEQRRQFDIRQAEIERSNKTGDALRWQAAGVRENNKIAKNIFEIPVSPDTKGAELDPFTGKYYVKQEIPQERQVSILSNLPGGKQQYVVNNRLYKVYNYKDDFGNMREQLTPFTDAEIIKHYLENDYQKKQSVPQTVASTQIPVPVWQIPKKQAAGTQSNKFDHSPY